MLNKIQNEINDFTETIKEIKGCEDMLTYVNSNISSCIKLLIFASKTFSIYIKIMFFLIISLAGLFVLSSISNDAINITLMLLLIILFLSILLYIIYFRNFLIKSIENIKFLMEES